MTIATDFSIGKVNLLFRSWQNPIVGRWKSPYTAVPIHIAAGDSGQRKIRNIPEKPPKHRNDKCRVRSSPLNDL